MPILIESPEFALTYFQKELFSEPIQWMAINAGEGSLKILYNSYDPLLSTKRMGDRESVDWAFKFMQTAMEKRVSQFNVDFAGEFIKPQLSNPFFRFDKQGV